MVALQPVQLVSTELAPGEMRKLAAVGSAATPPPPQPATTSRAGANRSTEQRSQPRADLPPALRRGGAERAAGWALGGKILLVSLAGLARWSSLLV